MIALPDGVFADLMGRVEALAGAGEQWDMKGGAVEGMQQFNDLGQRLVRLAGVADQRPDLRWCVARASECACECCFLCFCPRS